MPPGTYRMCRGATLIRGGGERRCDTVHWRSESSQGREQGLDIDRRALSCDGPLIRSPSSSPVSASSRSCTCSSATSMNWSQPLAEAHALPKVVVTVSLALPGALLVLFGLTHPERWLRAATRKLTKDSASKGEPEIRELCDTHVDVPYAQSARFLRSVHHGARQLSMEPEGVLRANRRMLFETLLQSSGPRRLKLGGSAASRAISRSGLSHGHGWRCPAGCSRVAIAPRPGSRRTLPAPRASAMPGAYNSEAGHDHCDGARRNASRSLTYSAQNLVDSRG